MKLQPNVDIGQYLVTAVGAGHIDINGKRHETGLLLFPQRIEPDWAAAGFDALSEADFTRIVDIGCDMLLLGTGARQRFPRPEWLRPFMAARIAVDAMDTAAACRTYNILALEGRNVAAALLIER